MIDTLNIAHYPLLAGLHCQSALTGRIVKCIENLFFDVDTPVPLFVAVGRKGDALCVLVLYYQSVNPLSFCHHNSKLMLWQNSQNKGVGYAYSFYTSRLVLIRFDELLVPQALIFSSKNLT